MTKKHGNHFFLCRAFWDWLPGKCCFHFPENPRISLCTSGNHDPVTAGIVPHLYSIFPFKNITVTDNRNRDCIFYITNDVPVCLSCIILDSCPSVNGNCRRTIFFHNLSKFRRIDMISIKAFSKLYGNRQTHCFRNLFYDSAGKFRIQH